MKQIKTLLFVLGILINSLPLMGRMLPVKVRNVSFSWIRDTSKPEQLPDLVADNTGNAPQTFDLNLRIVTTDGSEIYTGQTKISVDAEKQLTLTPFKEFGDAIKGQIALVHIRIAGENNTRGEISGIFGTPRPVPVTAGNLFGINVHLNRYRPSTRWRLLQMMKDAGITTVRVDSTFPAVDNEKARLDTIDRLREDILALEAFGMHSIVCIAYFNDPFKIAPNKAQLAYDWGNRLASSVKGRTSFHFGNETNSGWGAYGAAEDMAALNKAFALGVASADPQAQRGSFGIAEAPVSYVNDFCATGALDYLDAIAVHPYCGTPEAGIAKAVADRNVLDSYAKGKQLWATETGFHVDKGDGSFNETTGELTGVTGFSEELQMQLLARLYILAASYGIDRVYWYDFFGRNDPETYWLVAPDYKPRPAYFAYKNTAKVLNGVTPIDRTGFESPVQIHVFRAKDGSRILACWALQKGLKLPLALPKNCTISDCLGKPVTLQEGTPLELAHGPLFITGLTEQQMPSLINTQVMLSCFSERTFMQPSHRFYVTPGSTVRIPLSIFNGGDAPVTVVPTLLKQIPGWTVTNLKDLSLNAAPKACATTWMELQVPADAVTGVEYEIIARGTINGLQLTQPVTATLFIEGPFPYSNIMATSTPPTYKMRNRLKETEIKTGNPMLEIAPGKAIIDGALTEWKTEEFYPIDQKFYSALRNTAPVSDLDWSGKVALRWDKENLYAAFIVQDDQLCFYDFLSRDWRDCDNIRLLVSAVEDPAKRSKVITKQDILAIFAPTDLRHQAPPRVNLAALGGFVRKNQETRLKMAAKVWKNGYVLEVAIPFDMIGLQPESGRKIGLNVLADDVDDWHRQSAAMTRCENFLYWRAPLSTGNALLK